MHANNTNGGKEKLIYPELSYTIVGVCFAVHNEIGRFARERQYSDCLEEKLKEASISYVREKDTERVGNRFDFTIDNKIVIEVKAKRVLTKDDYYQIQRYLQMSNIKLGLLVNFRNRFLKPVRIVQITTDARNRFV